MENHWSYSLIRKEKTHSELVMKNIENWISYLFKKKSCDSTTTAANDVRVMSTCDKFLFNVSDHLLDAEIICCLHLVYPHQSYWSCSPFPAIFWRIFKTCQLAQQFRMKKYKARYLIVYGLYPALKAKQQANNRRITMLQCLIQWNFEHAIETRCLKSVIYICNLLFLWFHNNIIALVT